MTELEYRSHPAISRSSLWNLRKSPEYFRYITDNPNPPTPALLFGQMFHKLALEPDGFDSEFAVAPAVNRRTKDGKYQYDLFVQKNEGRTIVNKDSYDKAVAMVDSLVSAPFVKKLMNGEHEVPMFWTDEMTGEECKARADIITEVGGNPILVDLKTTSDASNEAFIRSAVQHGYDFQAAMYSEGFEKTYGIKPSFVFVAIEKEPPYSVNIFQADDIFVKRGYDIFRELIGIYHECRTTGNWYGYLGSYTTINNLSLPAWLAKEIE